MIIAILIGVWFNRLAKANKANQTVWVIVGILSYLAGQIIAGLIIGLIMPELIDERIALIIIGIIGGVAGVFIARYFLEKGKNNKVISSDDELLDDFIE